MSEQSPPLLDAEIGAMWEGLEELVTNAAPRKSARIMAAVRKVVDIEIRRVLLQAIREARRK